MFLMTFGNSFANTPNLVCCTKDSPQTNILVYLNYRPFFPMSTDKMKEYNLQHYYSSTSFRVNINGHYFTLRARISQHYSQLQVTDYYTTRTHNSQSTWKLAEAGY